MWGQKQQVKQGSESKRLEAVTGNCSSKKFYECNEGTLYRRENDPRGMLYVYVHVHTRVGCLCLLLNIAALK